MIVICTLCQHPFTTFPELAAHYPSCVPVFLRAADPGLGQKMDECQTGVVPLAPMGNVTEAVRESLAAMIDLLEVERYQENARAAELVKAFELASSDETLTETTHEHTARVVAFERVREIERDHGYRKGWNMRTRILIRRLESLLVMLDTGKPAHASGAV